MCNHEEADTRIMYHCTLEDKPTVVIATDTDILMVYAFASRLPDHDWFLKIRQNKFVNVSKIHDYIGNTVSVVVPAMFVLTGCDTVSYLFRRSKKTIFERGMKKEDLAVKLLSDLGESTHLSEASEETKKRFIQLFVYGEYVYVLSLCIIIIIILYIGFVSLETHWP